MPPPAHARPHLGWRLRLLGEVGERGVEGMSMLLRGVSTTDRGVASAGCCAWCAIDVRGIFSAAVRGIEIGGSPGAQEACGQMADVEPAEGSLQPRRVLQLL